MGSLNNLSNDISNESIMSEEVSMARSYIYKMVLLCRLIDEL